jgi:putative MATE family efflux protein
VSTLSTTARRRVAAASTPRPAAAAVAIAEPADAEPAPAAAAPETGAVNFWKDALPANDAIDKQILKLFIPAMLNFLIIPLVGAVDVFWVGRMGSAVALAAQGAANQVFQSAFWIISFVPSIIAPVVAKAAASGDTEEVQRATGEAIFVASLVGLFGMLLLTFMQDRALSIVGITPGSPTATQAGPYIGWRALTFIPAIISTVGFAAFRGTLDVTTPMKITLVSQCINLVLDPILIFGAGTLKAMGVAGAAMATSASEVTAAGLYLSTMLKRNIITLKSLFCVPSWANIGKLMVGGAAVQLRSIAQNITFIAVMRAILTMDSTGTSAAAHTVSAQMFQLGLIAVLALSTLASILIPQRLNAANKSEGGVWEAKKVADRLLIWGFLLGCFLGCLQAAALPALQFFTPLQNVQEMAKMPVLIGAVQMPLNGLVFVAEGLMQGHQAFMRLAGGMFVSTTLMIGALKIWGTTVEGVWCCFFVFNVSRLFFGLKHHFFDGPLAIAKLRGGSAEARAAPVDAKTAAEDVAAGFETASNKVASAFDSAAAELDAVFATAGLNPDDESDGKGALRRALRTP